MAKRCFDLSTTVPGSPDDVIDFLMDLENQRGLHPFLVSAVTSGTGTTHRGDWWDWDVVERPNLGPFHYRLRFRVRITRTSTTSLHSRLTALPGCHLRTVTRAEWTADGQTLLSEKVTAFAPFVLVGYLARRAKGAHTRTYAGLPSALQPTLGG